MQYVEPSGIGQPARRGVTEPSGMRQPARRGVTGLSGCRRHVTAGNFMQAMYLVDFFPKIIKCCDIVLLKHAIVC